jgi:hypothetical protein
MLLTILQSVITDQTLVPIGIALSLMGSFTVGILWLNGRLQKIDNRLASIESQHGETWTYSQMEAWALRFARQNPLSSVPELSNGGKARYPDEE